MSSQPALDQSASHLLQPTSSPAYITSQQPTAIMPLWLIYHPPNAYTDPSTKDALVKAVTSVYTTFGLTPPERGTEGERLWIEGNKPVPFA
ncbi:hypothetical protein J3F83DRAFT_712006 [Trichoderma novae-zelandiae]